MTGIDPAIDMASVVSVPADSLFSSPQDSVPTGMSMVAPSRVGLAFGSHKATPSSKQSRNKNSLLLLVSCSGELSELDEVIELKDIPVETGPVPQSSSSSGSSQHKQKRMTFSTNSMPSSSEDDLCNVGKRILVVNQEAKNEIHRQEALYWKVKREIMVAEAIAKGIKLPSSATRGGHR